PMNPLKFRSRLFAWLAGIPTALVLITGCSPDHKTTPSSQGESTAPKSQSRGTIGVSVLTLTNPFFKEIADTIKTEAAQHGYEVVVVSGEFDVARQQNQVRDFIVRKTAAIVLTPCDSKAIASSIKEANAAGIPVFTADIACLAPDAQVVCHV